MDDEALQNLSPSEWHQRLRRLYGPPVSSTETATPPNYSAWGRMGNETKREMAAQRMTASDREAYRRGLEAGQKRLRRVRALLQQVLRSLTLEGGRETP